MEFLEEIHDALAVAPRHVLASIPAILKAIHQPIKHALAMANQWIERACGFAEHRQVHEERAVRFAWPNIIDAQVVGAWRSVWTLRTDTSPRRALDLR